MKKAFHKFSKMFLNIMVLLMFENIYGQNHYIAVTYEPSIATSIFSYYQNLTNPPIDHYLSGRIANSVGLDYIFIFDSRTSGLKTGVYIIDNGYKERILIGEPINLNRTDKVYYHYFSLPIEFYKSFDKIYFNVGPNFNFPFDGYRKLGTGETIEYKIYNQIAFGLKNELGINLDLTKGLKLKLGAFNRLFLWAEGNMNYGFIIGLNYKFNK